MSDRLEWTIPYMVEKYEEIKEDERQGWSIPHLPVLNVTLLRDVVQWARASQEAKKESGWQGLAEVQVNGYATVDGEPLVMEWQQDTWNCGTACCIAGAAGLAIGAKYDDDTGAALLGDRQVGWFSLGAEALGLADFEADALFHGGNDLEDVEAVAEAIAEGRGLVLFEAATSEGGA